MENAATAGATDSWSGHFFFCLWLVCKEMVGKTRRKAVPRVAQEGGPVRPRMKGKVYLREEEEQLCRSVMHVSHDRIVGNQQRAGVFWERVSEHYDENKLAGLRPRNATM